MFDPPEKRTEETLLWVCVDFDKTVAETQPPDFLPAEPCIGAREKMLELYEAGYKAIIHTSRHWSDYELVEAWLNHHDIPFSRIVCGKPLARLYIDDKARHSSEQSWLPK